MTTTMPTDATTTPATPETSAPAPMPAREVDEGERQRRAARNAPAQTPSVGMRGPWSEPLPPRVAPPDPREERQAAREAACLQRAQLAREADRHLRNALVVARYRRSQAAAALDDAVSRLGATRDDRLVATALDAATVAAQALPALDAVIAALVAALEASR